MVAIEFNPSASWRGDNNVDAKTNVNVTHGDLKFKVSANDKTFGVRGGGVSTKGLVLGLEKSGGFAFDYDVANHSPTVTMHSGARFGNRDVRLKYKHGVRQNNASMEASFSVHDKHSATVRMNLQNYDRPDLKAFNLKWKYAHDEKWTAEPEFDFGSETLHLAVTHRMNDKNSFKGSFNSGNHNAGLEWTQRQKDGNLKLKMNANMNDPMKNPSVTLEKTMNFDV